MSQFTTSAAGSNVQRALRCAAAAGLLLVAGLLFFAHAERAGAGITNSIRFFNDTDVDITPVIDGHEYGPVAPGQSVNLSCTDDSNGITTLAARGDDFENSIVVTENRNNPVWVVSEDDLRSSPR